MHLSLSNLKENIQLSNSGTKSKTQTEIKSCSDHSDPQDVLNRMQLIADKKDHLGDSLRETTIIIFL